MPGVEAAPAASPEVVLTALSKLLRGLHRIPRHPQRRDIFLAILCLGMRRRHSYTEEQINDRLIDALRTFRASVDHVTCRRYLVDVGFVKRDRAGSRYFLNYPKLESTLTEESRQTGSALVAEALSRIAARRRRRAPGSDRGATHPDAPSKGDVHAE